MANPSAKRLLHPIYHANSLLKRRHESYRRFVYGIISRFQSQRPKSEREDANTQREATGAFQGHNRSKLGDNKDSDFEIDKYSSLDEDPRDSKWRLELAWLTKVLEPAFQFYRRALPIGYGTEDKPAPSNRSLAEIIASIQRSKTGMEGWTLSDLTFGLYLIYLRQASLNPLEDVKGVQVSSELIVQDLIYHLELAKGCYKNSATGVARHSMLRESNILKFVRSSSVMRPGYYIGIDPRRKLVILSIRGTHTVYDLITDIVSSSHEEVTFEGYSTHFGTAEAARWFITHEIETIRKCFEKYKGFRLRLVGHSLGGATASLLAIMLRKKSHKELGFDPEIVSAVGYATPPCVSKELAESCSNFVTTVVMQDDIIPRLSPASLARLRNEILQTDWMSVVEKQDWKSIIDLVTNAKQVVSSVQDIGRKLADYAKFRNTSDSSEIAAQKEPGTEKSANLQKNEAKSTMPEELLVPGSVYYLKRNTDDVMESGGGRGKEYFTLWKRDPGEHFQRIVLSGNLISDHKCDSHLYALRDVLKDLPWSAHEDFLDKKG